MKIDPASVPLPTPPEGWRQVQSGEKYERGDLWLCGTVWTPRSASDLELVANKAHSFTIRRIDDRLERARKGLERALAFADGFSEVGPDAFVQIIDGYHAAMSLLEDTDNG